MMNKKLKICILSLIVLLLSPTTIMAQEAENTEQDATSILPAPTRVTSTEMMKRHFGLFGGVTDPVERGYDAAPLFAVEVGYQPYVPFGLALEFLSEAFKNDDQPTLTRNQLMVKGSYNFGGDIPVLEHSYLGLGLGVVYENANDDTPSYLGIMPNIGFDIPLYQGEQFVSLGANLRYTATSSDEADSYSLNGVVKYWF